MSPNLSRTTQALDFLTIAEGTAYFTAMVTYLVIEGTTIFNYQRLTYNIFHTSAILCMTSFAIALSGILIYIIRGVLECLEEWYNECRPGNVDRNNAAGSSVDQNNDNDSVSSVGENNDNNGVSSVDQNNAAVSHLWGKRTFSEKVAFCFRTIVAPIVIIVGLSFMALASYQKAVGLNYAAQNFTQTHLSDTCIYVGFGLTTLAIILFMFFIALHFPCHFRLSYTKQQRNFQRTSHFLIVAVVLSAIFGISLIAAGQFTDPLSITSKGSINVTLWMTVAFTVVGVGVLIHDVSQAYLNAHPLETDIVSDDNNDDSLDEVEIKKKTYIDEHRKANVIIPIFTLIGDIFMIASIGMYDSVTTLNPNTQNFFKRSYVLLALGIACFGISFALKFMTDFSRHDVDHGIKEKTVNVY